MVEIVLMIIKINSTEYDICPFCGWEDDGTTDVDEYRSINKGSINEYRKKSQLIVLAPPPSPSNPTKVNPITIPNLNRLSATLMSVDEGEGSELR